MEQSEDRKSWRRLSFLSRVLILRYLKSSSRTGPVRRMVLSSLALEVWKTKSHRQLSGIHCYFRSEAIAFGLRPAMVEYGRETTLGPHKDMVFSKGWLWFEGT